MTGLLSVQLTTGSVMKLLLGTMTSLLSKSVSVVARICRRLTVPLTSPTVTVSPTRTGRSKRMIRPLTKLATISWRPKPNPTPRAAMIHCALDQSKLSSRDAITTPAATTA